MNTSHQRITDHTTAPRAPVFLSVVIPAYNEAQRIGPTLDEVVSYLSRQPYRSEVIVVDDGSTDDTVETVIAHADRGGMVRLLDGEPNHGKGYAVHRGMEAARGEWRLFMDADNSVSIRYAPEFIGYGKQGYQVVIGSIAHSEADGSVVDHAGWHRRFLGSLSKSLIRLCATPDIHDTQRGFKLFSSKAANTIFARQTVERFGFDIELLVIAAEHKFPIKEVPVEWNNADGSTVKPRDYFRTLRELASITANRLTNKYA